MVGHREIQATVSLLAAVLAMMVPGSSSGGVREPILAGSWYPGDAEQLGKAIRTYLERGERSDAEVTALIIPHAGYRYSGPTAGRGFAAVQGRTFDRVILLGPSHRVPLEGAALPDDEAWRTPLGDVEIDRQAIDVLKNSRGFKIYRPAHAQEHCLEIQIPFLQVALAGGFKIVPIVIGQINERLCSRLAAGIEEILDENTLIIISSDFTHYGANYGYVPFDQNIPEEIERLDRGAIACIEKLAPREFSDYVSRTGATICGAAPIRVLLTLLKDGRAEVTTLGYARSGDLMMDFSNSVSYASIAFASQSEPQDPPTGTARRFLDAREQSYLLDLARRTILAKLEGRPSPTVQIADRFPADSPLHEVRGLFVTLTKHGRLRGCMGNIEGTLPLAEGVAVQALVSAFDDPRFPPVGSEEIDETEIEISVLTPLELVSGPEEIEVGRHGVLLEKHGHRAVFLPQVATEQGWNRDTFLSQLCRKAGLAPEEWRSGAKLEVFEAQVFGETDQH
jgi:AmmeMemoRadiSam system protein B/AmmeMemoRadiSam system protein A